MLQRTIRSGSEAARQAYALYFFFERVAWLTNSTQISCYRDLGTVQAGSLNACIEACVDYNTNIGYKQCQAVTYNPKNNECFRINEPCYVSP